MELVSDGILNVVEVWIIIFINPLQCMSSFVSVQVPLQSFPA